MQKLLIVDDSRMFRTIVKKILGKDRFVTKEAVDGNEGFALYEKEHPDLTLLDITMPNCDGRECLAKIMEFNSNAKVIMISGIDDEATIDECLKLGALGYINKTLIDVSSPEGREKTLSKIIELSGV